MLKFNFLLLLAVTVDNVAAEADFSDTEICTDPTKNNCDPNAKCTRAVGGVNTDECTPKYFCECNEGYSGDGTKGNCQKPCQSCKECSVCPDCPKAPVPVQKDAVCAVNCDFTKKSLCNYDCNAVHFCDLVTFKRWTNDGRPSYETDPTMDNFFYLGWGVSGNDDPEHSTYNWNNIQLDFDHLNLTRPVGPTTVHLTVRLSSRDISLNLKYFQHGDETLIDFGSTTRGWQTVTATLPAGTPHFIIIAKGREAMRPAHFGIRKVEVVANC